MEIDVTLIDCDEGESRIFSKPMDGKPWQVRAKKAGLSQKLLASLTGQAENTTSRQLREEFGGGVPRYVKAVIWAWEQLPQKDRDAMVKAASEDFEGEG